MLGHNPQMTRHGRGITVTLLWVIIGIPAIAIAYEVAGWAVAIVLALGAGAMTLHYLVRTDGYGLVDNVLANFKDRTDSALSSDLATEAR